MMRMILIACLSVCFLISTTPAVFACGKDADRAQGTTVAATPAKGEVKTPEKIGTELAFKAKTDEAMKAGDSATRQNVTDEAGHKASVRLSHAQHSFDMDALIERIKKSHAIGVFTKLALRSDALDMIDLFRAYKKHTTHITLSELRARFDGLLLKTLALLDDDPALSREISTAREGIWNSLLEVKA